MSVNYEAIQQQAQCNWCRNSMLHSEPIGAANFVDVGKKYPALFCSHCLADEFKVRQPKSCINPDTLEEYYYIEELPDNKDDAAEEESRTQTTSTKEAESTSIQKD